MQTAKLNKEQKKKAIMARMLMGGNANEIGEEFNVNPITIGSWMRAHAKEADKDDVIDLKQIDPIALEIVSKEIKDKASKSETITTKQLNKLELDVDNIVAGTLGLKLLETEFHKIIMNLLKWANAKITDDMKISEWDTLVGRITQLHTALFKTSNTNINMLQQNNGGGVSSSELTTFKGGFRS